MYNKRIFISRNFSFEAAHFLPLHKGICKNLHGHRYEGKITISTENLLNGMVLDYSILKEIIQESILKVCDHKNLNEIFIDNTFYTTAENMCKFLFCKVEEHLNNFKNIKLEYIVLKETENSEAIVFNEKSSFLQTI